MSTTTLPTAQLIAALRKLGVVSDARPIRLALEPRVVFDAAGSAVAAEVLVATTNFEATGAASAEECMFQPLSEADALTRALSAGEPPTATSNVVFIDASVKDSEVLALAVQPGSEIAFISGDRDGLGQIATYLSGRTGIGAIHILSHGDAGELKLGSSIVSSNTIANGHSDELAAIRGALSERADILIYGCDVAAGDKGQAFVDALSKATGADVAASVDATGASHLGGDWDLETRSGQIDARSIFAPDYDGLLAPLTVTPVGTGGVTATTLAQQLMGSGVTVVSATLFGQNSQAGIFSGATGYSP